MFTEVIT